MYLVVAGRCHGWSQKDYPSQKSNGATLMRVILIYILLYLKSKIPIKDVHMIFISNQC